MADEVLTEPKGYTTVDAVQSHLGVPTLSPDQTADMQRKIAAAEVYIDNATRRSWLVGPVALERHDLRESRLFLTQAPVLSVSVVQVRAGAVGAVPVVLAAGVEWELFDADLGEIRLLSGYGVNGATAYVSYAPNRPVPNDITLAATQIVASSATTALYPSRHGVKMEDVDGVKYIYNGVELTIPESATAILNSRYLPMVV